MSVVDDPAPLALCVLGDGADERRDAFVRALPAGTHVLVDATGSARSLHAALELTPPHDVLLAFGDAPLAPGWVAALHAPAARDLTVASVRPQDSGALVLLTAPALELAGIDRSHARAADALQDFVERSTALGFVHVTEGGAGERGRSAERIGVTLDLRALASLHGGTQVHALELAAALARTGRLRLRAVVPPDLDPAAEATLARHDVGLLGYEEAALRPPAPSDLVHRPNQVSTVDDLRLLQPLGRRLVVTQQDLLTYRIVDYSGSSERWHAHRDATREALGTADHVVFFSTYVRDQALTEDLVLPERASVVAIGTDHVAVLAEDEGERPAQLHGDAPFLLCLGSDLRHKNRPFALELFAALRELEWPGRLVFAGPHVGHGSSRDAERAWLDASGVAPHVVELGPVPSPQRDWLMRRAAAVAYPSVSEGFGLLPFEAARAGVPCLFAAQGPLAELLPAATATITPWDARASARGALPLLSPGAEREQHVRALEAAARPLTWDACAAAMVEVYERTLAAPRWPAAMLSRRLRQAELSAARLEEMLHAEGARHAALIDTVGNWGMQLVGPDGVVPPEEREALTRLMYHDRLRRTLLAAFRLGRTASRIGRPR